MRKARFSFVSVKVLLFLEISGFQWFRENLGALPVQLLQKGMGIHLLIYVNSKNLLNIKVPLKIYLDLDKCKVVTKILTPLSHFDGCPFSSASVIGTDSNPPSACLKLFFTKLGSLFTE